MKKILFTGSAKCKVSFSSAQIVEHLSFASMLIYTETLQQQVFNL